MPTGVPRWRHAAQDRGHPLARSVAVAAAAVVGFVVVFAQASLGTVTGAMDSKDIGSLVSHTPDTPEPAAESGEPLNILLLGSDVRSGANAAIGGDVTDGMRSDVTVIAHISGDRSRVDLISIPRDLQVEIPDCTLFDGTVVDGGFGDFNAAFANGGRDGDPAEAAACTINTIHSVMDIRIDHFAVVDFTGFVAMVDALDGIPMCVPERIVSKKSNLDLEPGPKIFDGITALNWARLRTAEVGNISGSDLQRIERQQQLLAVTFRTAAAKNLFTDAAQLAAFIRAGAESLTTDAELGSATTLAGLGLSLRGLSIDDVTFATIPWQYTADRLDVVMTDDAETMLDDLRHDRELSVDAQGDATSAWDDGMAHTTPTPTPATSADAPSSSADDGTEGSAGEQEAVEDILAECTA
ncbi:LCP family protein [Demequina sp.]|uniref:LCP family protein n=1 Tax=Demequina sp. TaxID=2050685 RepID=UPI003A8AD65B